MDSAIAAAGLVVLVVLVVAVVAIRRRKDKDTFFTLYADEEPTRAETPYTGTVPFGPWGAKPWAETFPLRERVQGTETDFWMRGDAAPWADTPAVESFGLP